MASSVAVTDWSPTEREGSSWPMRRTAIRWDDDQQRHPGGHRLAWRRRGQYQQRSGALLLVNVSGNALANNVTNGVAGLGTLEINSVNTNTLSGALTDGATGKLAVSQSGPGTTKS